MKLSAPPTLRTLLHRPDLRLSLVSNESGLPSGSLDRPVRWVHNSDLLDPTPFLADDLVLLTTGTQFDDDDDDTAVGYVSRLVARGVLALGFGSGVHHFRIPEQLIAACSRAELALIEVPYDTPFLAIARAHAEAIAAASYARRTWALEAQRALAIAALRPRAVDSIVAELSRRIGCWVGTFDAGGTLVHQHPTAEGTASVETAASAADAVAACVAAMLARGGAASQTIEDRSASFTIFTLGRTGQLRGALAIAAAALDPETRTVVSSVIAMVGLALEQSEQLSRARRQMHTQLLALLHSGDSTLVQGVLGSLPAAPILLAVAETPRVGAVIDWWERWQSDAGTASFIADSGEGVEGIESVTVCLQAGDVVTLDELALRFDLRIGVSNPSEYADFSRAHAQAISALRRGGTGVTRYADATGGVLDSLSGAETRLLAAARLAPLRHHDDQTGAELEHTLRVWLEHDAHGERTAAALGIHRHTLRSRITQASALLDADLSSFPARAELWAALRAVD